MKKIRRKPCLLLALAAWLVGGAGCYKDTLPKEKDHLSKDMNYTVDNFIANLGRSNVFINIFNADYSTQPLDFAIENVRDAAKKPTDVLQQMVDTRQWKSYYSGDEKTITDIESKQQIVKRPVFDIRPHSGELIIWNTDSNTVRYGKYYFDVRVKNKAGERVFTNMVLDLRRPKPYDPYEFDDLTGIRKDVTQGGIIRPTEMSGVVDNLRRDLPKDSMNIYFVKTGAAKNTVTFRFVDKDSVAIPLTRFNNMRWDSLFYQSKMTGTAIRFGFNRKMNKDSTAVTYDITSPFPTLADVSSGQDQATIRFPYSRIAYGRRTNAVIGLTFSIFEPGEWTVVFKFRLNPKFEDD